MKAEVNTNNLRPLSQIFTPASFNRMIRENDLSSYKVKVSKYFPDSNSLNNHQLLKNIYSELETNYRCEYLFKNSLLNKILKKYSLSTSTAFNEFKIGTSKADLILLNGCIKIFEIKTELDDLSKLKKQISDYQKVADFVSIVTDHKFVKKLIEEYKGTNVGIIEFTAKNTFKTHQKALQNCGMYNFDTLFKLLHKNEYLQLISHNFNYVPNVPNTKIFRVCYNLMKDISIDTFQKQVLASIKKRKIECPEFLKSDETPVELRQICHALDFSANDYHKLFAFLNYKI